MQRIIKGILLGALVGLLIGLFASQAWWILGLGFALIGSMAGAVAFVVCGIIGLIMGGIIGVFGEAIINLAGYKIMMGIGAILGGLFMIIRKKK